MKRLRTAILGCGGFANRHAQNLLSLPEEIELTAFCDHHDWNARQFSEKYTAGQGAIVTDHRQLFERGNLDLVVICLPPFAHSDDHFGKEGIYRENGVVRTKWSKLMVLAGLLAARNRRPSDEEIKTILENTELQIDLHALGGRMGFANSYTTYIMQSGRRIDPAKIAANDVAYLPQEGYATSGFPRYRTTIRSYFPYDRLNPAEKAEIVLLKDNKKVSFALDFARYK